MTLPQTATKTVIQNKNLISWDSEPHYTAFEDNSFRLPEMGAGGVSAKTSAFIDTFELDKTAL